MAKAVKTRLLSFDMKDRPGLLSEVTAALAGAKVNITAICAYAWDDTAYFDMTTDGNAKAKKALAALKLKADEVDVIAVEMANRVGELQKVAKVLAEGGINIAYMYATASTGRTSTAVFSTSDNRKALRLINS
jgi:hypothetical protein